VECSLGRGLGLDMVAARSGPLDPDPAFGVGVEVDGAFFVAVAVAFADDRDLRVGDGLAVGEDAEGGGLVDVHIVGVGLLEAELDPSAFGLEDGVVGLAEGDEGHQAAASALTEGELGLAGEVLGFELFERAAPANALAVFAEVAAEVGRRSRRLSCGWADTLWRGRATATGLRGSGGRGDLLNAVGARFGEFELEATAEPAVERVDELTGLAVGAGDADLLDGDCSAVGVEEEVGAGGFETDPASGFAENRLAGDDPRAGGLGRWHEL